jgi:chromate reductase
MLYEGIAGLPPFNPDDDGDRLPLPVVEFRALMGDCAGIPIQTRGYAHGVPGGLKNALDWLVAGFEVNGKLVALFSASPRAAHAQASLREILTTMPAKLIGEAALTPRALRQDARRDRRSPQVSAVLSAALVASVRDVTRLNDPSKRRVQSVRTRRDKGRPRSRLAITCVAPAMIASG